MTTFWLIHVASAAVGLFAFLIFKLLLGKRLDDRGPEPVGPVTA